MISYARIAIDVCCKEDLINSTNVLCLAHLILNLQIGELIGRLVGNTLKKMNKYNISVLYFEKGNADIKQEEMFAVDGYLEGITMLTAKGRLEIMRLFKKRALEAGISIKRVGFCLTPIKYVPLPIDILYNELIKTK